MGLDGISGKWILSIDDKLTFCGVLEQYYEECAKYWRAESTRSAYSRAYDDLILPSLENHNSKAIDQYTKEDYDAAIQRIINHGHLGSVEFQAYADSTIQNFQRLIESVVRVAAAHGLCENVLWGSDYTVDEISGAEEERLRLKKSLTVEQEYAIAELLLTDPAQRGQDMGLLLMFALGLRNGEACGVNFGDFRPMRLHPEAQVLWVYKSTKAGTDVLQSSGKTRNADRIIPVPDKLAKFLSGRRRMIEQMRLVNENGEQLDIDQLPVACVNDDYTRRCSASQLTSAGRTLFRKINLAEKELAYIDAALSDPSLREALRLEKDPSAYLFRRNFGTHLYLLGLTEPEIQYVIGHDIENAYETRNEFVNEDRLWAIKCKMERRPILNSNATQCMLTMSTGTTPKYGTATTVGGKKDRTIKERQRFVYINRTDNSPRKKPRRLILSGLPYYCHRLTNMRTQTAQTFDSSCFRYSLIFTSNATGNYPC